MWVWGPKIPQRPGLSPLPPSAAKETPFLDPWRPRSLCLAQPAAWRRQLTQVLLPYPRFCPHQAQGLVSLRATGREVFDWILDQGYYSERDTSNVVRQVLEAVAYLHSLKIVHRNLKVRSEPESKGHLATGLVLGWAEPRGLGLASEVLMVSSAHPHAILTSQLENLVYYNRLKNSKIVISDFHLAKLENGLIKEPCGTPEYLGKQGVGQGRGRMGGSLQGAALGRGKMCSSQEAGVDGTGPG